MHPVSTADWVLYRPIEGTLSAQVSRSWGLNLVNVCLIRFRSEALFCARVPSFLFYFSTEFFRFVT